MKKGDIVREVKSGKIGMIVWKKNNNEIGVNFTHFQLLKSTNQDCSLNKLTMLGADDLYCKNELEAYEE
ncbi:MAG: hypothetical protein ABJH04_07775 [Cyclobacteriaceae bacterium]